ncbi:MAG: 4Fe-4S cluster-binding domain-containing protein, partial [Oscillospiraceae bacterium]|nr:4Fe-4S cluster-binding domain-containing protein [Oscillospiraceae bacterium]
MVSTVRIHSVETCGTVDGPGLRYITFFQGCNLRCKYCHNPDTWSVGGGTEMTVLELLEDVMKYKSYIKFSGGGFTACGGEPLLQAGAIAELFRQL